MLERPQGREKGGIRKSKMKKLQRLAGRKKMGGKGKGKELIGPHN